MKKLIFLFLIFALLPLRAALAQADSLDIKIGQLLLIGFRGTSVTADCTIAKDISDRHIGGVILFDYDVPLRQSGRNIQSPDQVKRLTASLQKLSATPLLIAIDQEGGKVNRLKEKYGFPKTVSAASLGAQPNTDSTRHAAARTASLLKQLGINLNFAPVADVNTNPDNPVIGKIERSFSSDAEVVSAHVQAVIRAHHAEKILTAMKHFPGHGSSKSDSHAGFVDVSQTWSPAELLPYRDAALQTDFIMTAHIYNRNLDSVPATLSHRTLQGLLRDSIGFTGAVISDDMQMGAIRNEYGLETAIKLSLNAGCDMLIFGNNLIYEPDIAERAISIIKNLIKRGDISQARINQAFRRITRLKEKLRTP